MRKLFSLLLLGVATLGFAQESTPLLRGQKTYNVAEWDGLLFVNAPARTGSARSKYAIVHLSSDASTRNIANLNLLPFKSEGDIRTASYRKLHVDVDNARVGLEESGQTTTYNIVGSVGGSGVLGQLDNENAAIHYYALDASQNDYAAGYNVTYLEETNRFESFQRHNSVEYLGAYIPTIANEPDWSIFYNRPNNQPDSQGRYPLSVYDIGNIDSIVAERADVENECFDVYRRDDTSARHVFNNVPYQDYFGVRLSIGQYRIKGYSGNTLVHQECVEIGPAVRTAIFSPRVAGDYGSAFFFEIENAPNIGSQTRLWSFTNAQTQSSLLDFRNSTSSGGFILAENLITQGNLNLIVPDLSYPTARRYQVRGPITQVDVDLTNRASFGTNFEAYGSVGTTLSSNNLYLATVRGWRHIENIRFVPVLNSYGSSTYSQEERFNVLSEAYTGNLSEDKQKNVRVRPGRYRVESYRNGIKIHETGPTVFIGPTFSDVHKARSGGTIFHNEYLYFDIEGNTQNITFLRVNYEGEDGDGNWTAFGKEVSDDRLTQVRNRTNEAVEIEGPLFNSRARRVRNVELVVYLNGQNDSPAYNINVTTPGAIYD